jgi:hypothetical protein
MKISIIIALSGIITGALVMYLFDPESGRKRRLQFRKKIARNTEQPSSVIQEYFDKQGTPDRKIYLDEVEITYPAS